MYRHCPARLACARCRDSQPPFIRPRRPRSDARSPHARPGAPASLSTGDPTLAVAPGGGSPSGDPSRLGPPPLRRRRASGGRGVSPPRRGETLDERLGARAPVVPQALASASSSASIRPAPHAATSHPRKLQPHVRPPHHLRRLLPRDTLPLQAPATRARPSPGHVAATSSSASRSPVVLRTRCRYKLQHRSQFASDPFVTGADGRPRTAVGWLHSVRDKREAHRLRRWYRANSG